MDKQTEMQIKAMLLDLSVKLLAGQNKSASDVTTTAEFLFKYLTKNGETNE